MIFLLAPSSVRPTLRAPAGVVQAAVRPGHAADVRTEPGGGH